MHVCGRSIAGMEDARKEGGRWFCSPSCLMQGSSGTWKQKPRHKWRRRILWTVGIIVVLLGGLIALGAAVGTKKAHGHRSDTGSIKATAIPASVRPIRVGSYGGIGDGWRLKVLSVDWHARPGALGLQPTKGAQDVVARVKVKYFGGGSASTQDVVDETNAIGSHHAVYQSGHVCGGNLEFGNGGISVFSHQTAEGNVCFQIAKNDAHVLRL